MTESSISNDILRTLISEDEIRQKVHTLGQTISREYAGKNPLLISVLKGSVVFMADLMRAITVPCEIDFMCVESYGKSVKTSGVVNVTKDISQDVSGRDLIIVEDILDSGITLYTIKNLLKNRGAKSIKICTLLDKPERRQADVTADYRCFCVPDEFVVGYGLDFSERYRNLPYIGVLNPEINKDII